MSIIHLLGFFVGLICTPKTAAAVFREDSDLNLPVLLAFSVGWGVFASRWIL